jgi:preprotein translocase subunit SecD
MSRSACSLAAVLLLALGVTAWAQDKTSEGKVLPGVYAVLRDSLDKKDVLPVKDGEVLVVNHHRYVKKADKEAPRFVVVRSVPDVQLDLLGKPKPIKDGAEVTGILLTLKPKAAKALEQLTRDRLGGSVAIVIGGEVVTMHKIREVIKGGEVKITSCAPGGAKYLLEQLEADKKK